MNIYETARYVEEHVHDAKHIHYITTLARMSDNLPKAYQYADDKLHHICAWCPDKEEADRLARAVEMKKWIESMHAGVSEYIKRQISHTICDPCSQKLKQN